MGARAARPEPASLLTDLAELVLPGGCAGCGETGGVLRYGVCSGCVAWLTAWRPQPVRPDPAPPGLPPCAALGEYAEVLRELVLAYKDRGRHRLARPLGRLLAAGVAWFLTEGEPLPPSGRQWRAPGRAGGGPGVLLVPIPDSPAAARARHGDHLRKLARPAAAALRATALPATVATPLRARGRPDSAGLDHRARAAVAHAAIRIRPGRALGVRHRVARTGEPVILLDDVVTTGATLAAAANRLAAAGIPVAGAVVLAATRRWGDDAGAPVGRGIV